MVANTTIEIALVGPETRCQLEPHSAATTRAPSPRTGRTAAAGRRAWRRRRPAAARRARRRRRPPGRRAGSSRSTRGHQRSAGIRRSQPGVGRSCAIVEWPRMPKLAANLSLLFPQTRFPRPLCRRGARGVPRCRVPVSLRLAEGRRSPSARARRAWKSCCTTSPRATRPRATAASPACRSASPSSAKAWSARIEYAKAAALPAAQLPRGSRAGGCGARAAVRNAGRERALRRRQAQGSGTRAHARADQHAHGAGLLPHDYAPGARGARCRRRGQRLPAVRHLPHADHGRRPGEAPSNSCCRGSATCSSPTSRTGTSRAPARSISSSCCATSTASATPAGSAANTIRSADTSEGLAWAKPYL